ncbi:MAG TPA: hypothetical protein VN222_10855 [Novosphingobium sp.]|nr:hypothetical protein [Novosphingobium sp.]
MLDRIKSDSVPPVTGDALLGNWYVTALLWRPQVALLISERTLLPVLIPLAPAATLGRRFPDHLAQVLRAHGVPAEWVAQEIWRMGSAVYAKTANRRLLGMLNQFSF